MQRKFGFVWSAAIVLAWVVGIGAWAGENVWVSAEGEQHRLHDGQHAVFFGEGGSSFDLSDLADGETRVFGSGDRQVTASRSGDEATIERRAHGDDDALTVTCRLSSDTCQVLTFDDDPEKVMIMIQKSRTCENGEGDCDLVLDDLGVFGGSDDAAHVIVRKTVECVDDEDCSETEDVSSFGGHGAHMVRVESAGRPGEVVVIEKSGSPMVFIGDRSRMTLSCPEGDASLRVKIEEADEVFLCPKHSVPLEKSERETHLGHIEIKAVASPDDSE